MDGRSDFYGDDFEEKYIDVLNVKYGWEKTLSRLRRRHDFNAPQRAADRRAEGIQPLARRLRRRHRAGVPVRTRGPRAQQVSAASNGGGEGRDREVTKTQASDHAITETKPKT